jgi:hypothetical protein
MVNNGCRCCSSTGTYIQCLLNSLSQCAHLECETCQVRLKCGPGGLRPYVKFSVSLTNCGKKSNSRGDSG